MRKLGLFLIALTAFAQSPFKRSLAVYTVTRDTTLSASSEAITIQQPATGSHVVEFVGASIYCAASCNISQERNGSAATATAATIALANPEQGSAAATAWYQSNVGSPASTLPTFTINGGGSASIDLQDMFLVGNGTGKNYTLRVGPTTGRVIITIKWRETSQ